MPVTRRQGCLRSKRLPRLRRGAIFKLADLLSPFSPRETGRKTYNYSASSWHPSALVMFQTGNILPVRSSIMKKFTALVLFCSFTVAMAQTASSQSRPRRVGATPPPQQEPQTPSRQPEPEPESSGSNRPTRPPVLGGATRDPNEQRPEAKQKDAGPEEVGGGDVVKG